MAEEIVLDGILSDFESELIADKSVCGQRLDMFVLVACGGCCQHCYKTACRNVYRAV